MKCLFIVSKVKEIESPSIIHFLHCINMPYTNNVLWMEQYMLKALEWNFSYPNPIHFLQRASMANEYDVKTNIIVTYFLEISYHT